MATSNLRAKNLVAPGAETDLARHIIDFDPRDPSAYVFSTAPGTRAAVAMARTVLAPDPIPWPTGKTPTPTRPTRAPAKSAPLPQADVLVVTYTVAEGYALADVLTPGWDSTQWYPYRNGWTALKKTVAKGAPSLERNQAGLWATCTVGDVSVVAVKSDLHPSTDGAQLPIRALWKQMIEQVQPKLVITTGTAGAVGADVLLGDVVVSRHVRWDCTLRFPDAPWAHSAYSSRARLVRGQFDLAHSTLIPVNATHLPAAARTPVVIRDTAAKRATVISTDFFAFDDADNGYGLRTYQPDAAAVEMDDAALGLACTDLTDPPQWFSVRNASDPQMNGATLATEKKQAAAIYEKYGYWTSIGSVIACWALIAKVT
jgi:nucleoside phosphorylase